MGSARPNPLMGVMGRLEEQPHPASATITIKGGQRSAEGAGNVRVSRRREEHVMRVRRFKGLDKVISPGLEFESPFIMSLPPKLCIRTSGALVFLVAVVIASELASFIPVAYR